MQGLKTLLTSDGIVVSNLRPGFESYHYHRRTFNAVFRNQYSYGSGGNVIVIVDTREKPLDRKVLSATARRLQKDKQFTADLAGIIEEGGMRNDYVRKGPILTDDYAPTDILRSIPLVLSRTQNAWFWLCRIIVTLIVRFARSLSE